MFSLFNCKDIFYEITKYSGGKMFQIVKINAKYLDGKTGNLLPGKAYKVRVYDKDILIDGLMGEVYLSGKSTIELITSTNKADFIDSSGETKFIIYFVVDKNYKPIYKSNVPQDVGFLKKDEFPIAA